MSIQEAEAELLWIWGQPTYSEICLSGTLGSVQHCQRAFEFQYPTEILHLTNYV